MKKTKSQASVFFFLFKILLCVHAVKPKVGLFEKLGFHVTNNVLDSMLAIWLHSSLQIAIFCKLKAKEIEVSVEILRKESD